MPKTGYLRKWNMFASEYAKSFNAKESAIKAGYRRHSASVIGSQLLTKPKIQDLIRLKTSKRMERVELTGDFVLKELVNVAGLDMKDALDDNGNMLSVNEMPEHVTKAMQSIEINENHTTSGQFVGYTKKIKLWDKIKALEMLGKHLRLWADRVEVTAAPDLLEALEQMGNERGLPIEAEVIE